MNCRLGCSACCIAPSISSKIPGMPEGKPAGIPCIQLDEQGLCKLFGSPDRPKVCGDLAAHIEMCGDCEAEAMAYLTNLEAFTSPKK